MLHLRSWQCVQVQFSSRWYLCARKSPYALHPFSQKFPQRWFWNSSNVRLIDDGPLSSFQGSLACTGVEKSCTCYRLTHYWVNLKGWAEEANRQTSWTTVRPTAERPLETLLGIVQAPLTYLASGLAGSTDLLASRLFCQRQEDAAGYGTSHTHPQNAGCQNLQTSIN